MQRLYKVGDYVFLVNFKKLVLLKSEKDVSLANEAKSAVRLASEKEVQKGKERR
ncbi:hypothetical protein MOE86_15585 [Bacillus atrophaeus]|uniref:hypothetical protein n=1 Tax=Bacillus atrophaeus TaxID=1452 RepID=UPI00227EA52A|nr:hypothetical protein [Bacillus atrophaeus]MCY9198100.1 hypothetical protein [Bacillus atrophaeus]